MTKRSRPGVGRGPLGLLALALFGLVACGPAGPRDPTAAPEGARPRGFQLDPSFAPGAPLDGLLRSGLSVEGDILVFEGDARYVSASGPGRFGLTEDNQRALVQDAFTLVPDRFDTLVLFTAFADEASATRSYYQALRNRVSGIGLQLFDDRSGFGLSEGGRLSGYVGMGSPLEWGEGSLAGLDAPQGAFHAAIARELAHRWAFYLRFDLPSGAASSSLLGADDRDWSSLAQADGSILGGNRYERVGDPPGPDGFALYENTGRNLGFAPLDLYAMGRLPLEQVPVLFYLSEATVDMAPVDRATDIPVGTVVRGIPNLVSPQQVLDAMGPRSPSADAADPYYRVAFAFVTTPGAPRSAWEDQLELLERVRADLPASWAAWGAGNLCTRIAEPCPEPQLELGEVILEDDDGLVAPGETVGVRLEVENFGVGTAAGVDVELRAVDGAATVTGGPLTAPDIPQGASVTLPDAFSVTVTSSIACGTAVRLRATMISREGPAFEGEIALPVGTDRLRLDAVEEDVDWRVDPDGTDTAMAGAWALGDPEESVAAGITAQPEDDHTPGEGKLAFFTGPPLLDFFASNDLDEGRTTLESPVYALRDAQDPLLVFWAWRSVWDFASDPPEPQTQAPLVVEVSDDGGASYVELGRFEQQTEAWTRVGFRIRDAVELTNRIRFRFVVEETEPGNVEVGIDDLEILDFLASCRDDAPEPMPPDPGDPDDDDDGGGGCRCLAPRAEGPANSTVWIGLLFASGALGVLRRRARGSGRG